MTIRSVSVPATGKALIGENSKTVAPSPQLFRIEIGTKAKWATWTLQQRGFVLRGTETGLSWHWQVGAPLGKNVPRAHRKSTSAAVMEGPAGEHLQLVVIQTQNGAAVSRISARWPDMITPAMLSDAFERRYDVSKGTINTTAIRAKGELGWVVQPSIQLNAEARLLVLDAEADLRALEQVSVERAVRDGKRAQVLGW
jgi:hypothetical protein